MISTTDLTGTQLEQLEALLAATTPGGGVYRPAVARDTEVLQQLEQAGLARYFEDVTFETYETTDAGKAIVVDRAMDAAASEAFVRCASKHELRESIERLKAVFNDLTDPVLRDRTLQDIEACQDRLDELTEVAPKPTGRHRATDEPAFPDFSNWRPLPPLTEPEIYIPPRKPRSAPPVDEVRADDDQPTETIDRVELPTEPLPLSGTLPSIPVAEILTDREGAERLLAAIQDTVSPDDVADFLAEQHTADEWAALEADLADESSWWQRNVTDRLNPRRKFVLAIVATVVVTWFAAWLVMA